MTQMTTVKMLSENRNDDTLSDVIGNGEHDNEMTEIDIPFLSEVNTDSE